MRGFSCLPAELRLRIWELTVEPRTVEVRVGYHYTNLVSSVDGDAAKKRPVRVRHLRSPTPVPAQLQTCREAYEHLTRHPHRGYERALSEIMTNPSDGCAPVPEGDPERDRYVWLNWTIDMLSVGKTDLEEIQPVFAQIGRLRFERVVSDEFFFHRETRLINSRLSSLTEIHIICLEGLRMADGLTEYINFPCPLENVYWTEPEKLGGKMMNAVELEALVAKEWRDFEERELRESEGLE